MEGGACEEPHELQMAGVEVQRLVLGGEMVLLQGEQRLDQQDQYERACNS